MSHTPQRRRDQRQPRGSAQRDQDDPRASRPRTPELISFAVSLLIVLGLVAAVISLYIAIPDAPPLIEARANVDAVRQEGELFYIPIVIENRGGKAGEEVTVRLSMTDARGEQQVAQLSIAFLAAGETVEGMVAVRSDPRGRQVEVSTIGYLEAG